MSWGSLNQAPPFRVSADTTADLGDLVRASRLASPSNAGLLQLMLSHVNALTSALKAGRQKEEIVREAMAIAAFACRVAEEGESLFSDVREEKHDQR